ATESPPGSGQKRPSSRPIRTHKIQPMIATIGKTKKIRGGLEQGVARRAHEMLSRPGFTASRGLRNHATSEKQMPAAQMLKVGAKEPTKKKLTTEYTPGGLRKCGSRLISNAPANRRTRHQVTKKDNTTSSGKRNPPKSMSRSPPRCLRAVSSIGCKRTMAEKMIAAGRVVALTATAAASKSPAANIRRAVGRLATTTA